VPGFRPRFFAPAGSVAGPGDVLALDAEDSHHALRVLRLRPGDECEVVVGAAVHAATVLPGATGGASKSVQLRLGAPLEGADAGARYEWVVALVQALARSASVDWSVEKSTESGASLIILVPAAGSPRPAVKDSGKQSRWSRIAREAAKQSKQPAVPEVEQVPSFAAALALTSQRRLRPVVLDPLALQTLYELLAPGGAAAGVALWIGPESGWTEEELEVLKVAGAEPARLGRGVLRTETAGAVAVAVARLALGDW
jgi:16S rRNA (uracil1498-N3)-methyltransferase